MTGRRLLLIAIVALVIVPLVEAQSRKLGPQGRDVILNARADPSFASTPLTRVIFLPFANELDYTEGADVLAQNFVGAMHQTHSEIEIVAPEAARQMIQDLQLTNEYRSFAGNYANTGVATTLFLQALGQRAKADGVVLGKILGYGAQREAHALVTGFGMITWNKDRAVAGMEITLVRSKDGRELWWGAHAVEGGKNENVLEVAKTVGTVFAKFFGRLPY